MSKTVLINVEVPVEDVTIEAVIQELSVTNSSTWIEDWSEVRANGEFHGIRIWWHEDGERYDTLIDCETKYLTWRKLAEALGTIAVGHGMSDTDYHSHAAIQLLTEPTSAEYDSDTVDLMVQIAAHGEIVFG